MGESKVQTKSSWSPEICCLGRKVQWTPCFSLFQEAIKQRAIERARQDEWEKENAIEALQQPINPFQGMRRQATLLAQQMRAVREQDAAETSEESPRQPPALPGSAQPSPAASMQAAALKEMMKAKGKDKDKATPIPSDDEGAGDDGGEGDGKS